MDTNAFEVLLTKVSHFITKRNTVMQDAIPPREKLALILQYLATGNVINFILANFIINFIFGN